MVDEMRSNFLKILERDEKFSRLEERAGKVLFLESIKLCDKFSCFLDRLVTDAKGIEKMAPTMVQKPGLLDSCMVSVSADFSLFSHATRFCFHRG